MRMVFLYVSFVCLALSSNGLVNADIFDDLDKIGEEIDKEVDKLAEDGKLKYEIGKLKHEIGRFYGGVCLADKMCYHPVSYCERRAGITSEALGSFSLDGKCRP